MEPSDRFQQEKLVDQHVQQNDLQAAVRLLYDLIAVYAKEKNFDKAKALHDKMYAVDPMALTEIVRASEIIEAEKSETLDPEYLELWPDLYKSLNTAEGNALFYSIQPATFESGDPIVSQGKINNRLYFILSGEISAFYTREDTELLIGTLSAGDIAGQSSFFSATVCTASMNAKTRVKAGCLGYKVLKKWRTEFPALEGKLRDYCKSRDRIQANLAEKQIERRSDKRLTLSGRLAFQLLDKSGKPMAKAYKGEVADISSGGLSFLVKSSREDNLYMLLGRRIHVGFQVPLRSGHYQTIAETMTVIAIQSQIFDDYSVHVKFDKPKDAGFIRSMDTKSPVNPA
ncbi:MAG: cyclic nucleotide-binding domain-containing protein [Desulfosalsimonadaceae bacterium]